MAEFRMPRLSDSMEEGTVVSWLKADGELVRRGDPLVEIESDKATLDVEADEDGHLAIVLAEGGTAPVGAVIAYIGDAGDVDASASSAPAPVTAAPPEPVARPATNGAAVSASPVAVGAGSGDGRLRVSPVARRLALALQVDLTSVTGSGRLGRILKADVRRVAAAVADVPARALTPAAAPEAAPTATARNGEHPARGEATRRPLTRIQQVVARRMAESKASIPDFWTSVDVDMAAVVSLRDELKALHDAAPSINDVIVAATARALRRHPRVNAGYRDGELELWERVNVGIAVATEDGLVVPTIFDADRASLTHVAAESRRLATRVRSGEVTPAELSGATFTVSNLGMFGVSAFGGIVDSPQAGILCVGAVAERPWVVDGQLAVRPVATLTLVADHRILYGADAAAFLSTLRGLLSRPLLIMA